MQLDTFQMNIDESDLGGYKGSLNLLYHFHCCASHEVRERHIDWIEVFKI